MIFLGDVAHPFRVPPTWIDTPLPWRPQPVVVNLEGALVPDNTSERLLERRVLFNNISVMETLLSIDVRAANLANNHTTDIPGGLNWTIEHLLRSGILPFGAGETIVQAEQPGVVVAEGQSYILLGFGWTTVQCRRATRSCPGVNPLEPKHVIRSVRYWREKHPDAAIVVIPHWNYEMELYPQPAHRQLAYAVIDAGACAVIGHHPHRVGGIEIYRGCPIVYSLGNWWLPQGTFFNGKLVYDSAANLQLALEWSPGEEPVLHWFTYDPSKHSLSYIGSEHLSESDVIKQITPFDGMTHEEYVDWFRTNRVKRKLLPIYTDYRHSAANAVKDLFVHVRHWSVLGLKRIAKKGRG